MGDLNGLIKSLREEIAIAGPSGATIHQVLQEIEAFYQRKKLNQDDDSIQIQTVDRPFQERVWGWLLKDQLIRVGANNEGKNLTLDEIDAQEVPLRLFTTEQQIWVTLTGHEKDGRKIPAKMFELLEIIAARKGQGITQPELVRLSGQDKRSVPMRTQKLSDQGLVKKIPVLANHSNTSLIIHTRFIKDFEAPAAGEELTATSISESGPDRLFLGHNRFVRVEKQIRDAMSALEESGGLLMWFELKRKIDVTDSVTSKLLASAVRRLEELGITARVRASANSGRTSTNNVLHRCIKLIRSPTEHDWRSLFEWTKQEQSKLVTTISAVQSPRQESAQDDHIAPILQGVDEASDHGESVQDLYVPIWSPDRLIAHTVRSALLSVGTTGLATKDLKRIVAGPCYIRPIDRLLDRCVWNWHKSQPLHLRHLAIVRDSAQIGKTSFYVHFVYDAFGIKVENGETLWEAVQDFSRVEDIATIDGKGFAMVPTSKFAGQMNEYSLAKALESVGASSDTLQTEDMIAGVTSSAGEPGETQASQLGRKPKGRPSTEMSVVSPKPNATIGRPRKYPGPGIETDTSKMSSEQRRKTLSSQQRAQQYLRKKAHKLVGERVILGMSQAEAEACTIAELGLTPEVYAGTSSTLQTRPDLTAAGKQEKRTKTTSDFLYLPSIAAHTFPTHQSMGDSKASIKRSMRTRTRNPKRTEKHQIPSYLPSIHAHSQPISSQSITPRKGRDEVIGHARLEDQGNIQSINSAEVRPVSQSHSSTSSHAPAAIGAGSTLVSAVLSRPLKAIASEATNEPTQGTGAGVNGTTLEYVPLLTNPAEHAAGHSIVQPKGVTKSKSRKTLSAIGASTMSPPKATKPRSIRFLPLITGHREDSGRQVTSPAAESPLEQRMTTGDPIDYSAREASVIRSAGQNGEKETGPAPGNSEPTDESPGMSVVIDGDHDSPVGATGANSFPARGGKMSYSKLPHFGGTIAAMRKLIILEIVTKAGGIFPGDGELVYPFLTAYVKKFPDAKPDNKTIKIAKTTLVGEGKLKQLFFSYKSNSGILQMRSVIALPDIPDEDPRIKQLQHFMSKTHPHPYFPPGTDIRDDLMPKAASYNSGIIGKLRLAQYANELPVIPDVVVRQFSKRKVSAAARRNTTNSDEVLGTADAQLEQGSEKLPSKRKRNSISSGETENLNQGNQEQNDFDITQKRKSKKAKVATKPSVQMDREVEVPSGDIAQDQSTEPQSLPELTPSAKGRKRKASKKAAEETENRERIGHHSSLTLEPSPKRQRRGLKQSTTVGTSGVVTSIWHDGTPNSGTRDTTQRASQPSTPSEEEHEQNEQEFSETLAPGPKRKQRAFRPVAKARALEVLAQKDESTPGIRYSKGKDSQSRPVITRRTRYLWNLQDDRKLFIGATFCHIALGGVREENQWAIVSRMLGHKYDKELCRRRWAPIRSRYRNELEVVAAELRTALLNSYEEGNVPKLDYSNFWDNDWTGILAWAVDKIDSPEVKDIELPPTREAFEAAFLVKDFSEPECPDFLETKRAASLPVRLNVLNSGSRVVSEASKKIISELDLAKTWVKANILTPEETYDSILAKDKLQRFSDATIEDAINELQNDRVIASKNKGRALPTRAFDMSNHFLRAIQWKLSVGHFKYATAFKEILDGRLKNDGMIEYKPAFGNGEMITMLNLLAEDLISLEGKNIPNARWGLTSEGYKTRSMDKTVYSFDVLARPTEQYAVGLPVRPFPPIPTKVQDNVDAPIEDERIPLWVDINGDIASIIWEFSLAAVATVLVISTSATTEHIAERLQPCIADFEVRLIIQWLVDAGVAEWKDEIHDVINLKSYWWSIITTPLAKGSGSDEVVMIAGEPLL